MMREYTAKEESSVYIYVSNENPTVAEVYFDDFKIKHVKGPVLQYNEYYPYGLQTANSWTRENSTQNNFFRPVRCYPPHSTCLMMREYTAKEESIVYIYMSNENPTVAEVYFNDFKIKHVKSPVLQYNEYYPYGLQTANSWTRENSTQNNFLANGGTELNTTTSVYDLHYRNYDPALGRMNQVDPAADSYGSLTPYNYAFNAPTVMNDPLGDDPMFDRDAWRGGARGATYYNPMVKDAGSSGRVGGSVLNPGFSNETWGAIGGTINTMFANTNDFDGYSTWAPGGSINYFSGNGRGLFTERGTGGVMNMLVPEFSYREWLYPDGSTSLPYDVRLTGFVMQLQTQGWPTFQELWQNYPHDLTGPNGEIIHQAPSKDGYEHQCAIRLSKSMIDSGVDLSTYTDPVTSEGWARGSSSLRWWLSLPSILGSPSVIDQDVFERDYMNKTGIMYQAPVPGDIGHIDLWNKGDTGSGYYLASKIWFWEIK